MLDYENHFAWTDFEENGTLVMHSHVNWQVCPVEW